MPKKPIIIAVLLSLAAVAGFFFWKGVFPAPAPEDERLIEDVLLDIADVPEEEPAPAPAEEAPRASEPVDPASVPFLVQAPFGEWAEEIFENACEEASILMAKHWAAGTVLTPEQGKEEILDLVAYQEKEFGHSIDTSPEDTLRMLTGFLGTKTAETRYGMTIADMREVIAEGKVFIVPADGRKLGNPNFTPPGPPVHMLLVIGYDPETKEFITNDPGTRRGKGYRYAEDVLYAAIGDYPTGKHVEVNLKKKAAIIIWKPGAAR